MEAAHQLIEISLGNGITLYHQTNTEAHDSNQLVAYEGKYKKKTASHRKQVMIFSHGALIEKRSKKKELYTPHIPADNKTFFYAERKTPNLGWETYKNLKGGHIDQVYNGFTKEDALALTIQHFIQQGGFSEEEAKNTITTVSDGSYVVEEVGAAQPIDNYSLYPHEMNSNVINEFKTQLINIDLIIIENRLLRKNGTTLKKLFQTLINRNFYYERYHCVFCRVEPGFEFKRSAGT